jgi:hypothetical protein
MGPRAVLLVEGGIGHQSARVTVVTARLLHAVGSHVEVLTWNPSSLAGASRSVTGVLRVRDAAAARAAIAASSSSLILPTSDAAAVGIGAPAAAVVDKRRMQELAGERDVPTPDTAFFGSPGELRDAAGSLPYPVVVKPVVGKPVAFARSAEDLAPFLARVRPDVAIAVQPRLTGAVRSVAGVVRAGRLLAVVHQVAVRAWPSAAGTTTAAETTGPVEALEGRTAALAQGFDGIVHAQFLDGLLLDLNLRPYGSMALAAAAGVNLPALCLDGGSAPGAPLRARPGVRYRWIEGDLRLAASRIRRAPARAATIARDHRPRAGTAHGDASSIRDPGPALARLTRRSTP